MVVSIKMEQNQKIVQIFLWISVYLGNLLSVTAGLLFVFVKYGQSVKGQNLDDQLNWNWWLEASLPLGAICGSLIAGIVTQGLGRKYSIVALEALFALSFLVAAFSMDNTTTLFSVFLGGVSTGGTFVTLTIYLVEISEVTNRSKICSTMNVGYCIGSLMGILIGINVSTTAYNITCAIIAGGSALLFYLYAQETPQFLISKNNEETAKLVMQKLRRTLYVDQEILEIKDALISRKIRIQALLFCLALFAFQSLSGANVGVDLVNLFQISTLKTTNTLQATMFFAPFAASMVVIMLVEHFGEKKLLAISAIGVLIPQVILAIYLPEFPEKNWANVLLMVLLKSFYAAGLATLPWIISAQILQPCKLTPFMLGITSSLTWLLTFLVYGYFISAALNFGIKIYWAFSVFNLLAGGFAVFLLPDISKKTIKEISELF